MKEELEFENIFVDYILARIKSDHLTKMGVSNIAFPELKKPVRALQKMTTEELDKRQRMTLEDAHKICRAMGITLSYVCSIIENGDAKKIIEAAQIEKGKPGRKKKQAAVPQMEQLALSNNAEAVEK